MKYALGRLPKQEDPRDLLLAASCKTGAPLESYILPVSYKEARWV